MRFASFLFALLPFLLPQALAQDASSTKDSGEVVLHIGIETHDAARQLGQVMQILVEEKLIDSIPVVEHKIVKGESVRDLLRETYKIPDVTEDLKAALNAINPQLTHGIDYIDAGDKFKMPATLERFDTSVYFSAEQMGRVPQTLQRSLTGDEGAKDSPFVRIHGFNLSVTTADLNAAENAAQRVYDLNVPGVLPSISETGAAVEVPRYTSPQTYYDDCTKVGQGAAGEAAYAELLGSAEGIELLPACLDPVNWPKVLLLDQPIFEHEELRIGGGHTFRHSFRSAAAEGWLERQRNGGGIIEDGNPIRNDAPDNRLYCETRDFKAYDHGTYLAGIMSSVADGAGFKSLIPGLSIEAAPTTPDDGGDGSIDEVQYRQHLGNIYQEYQQQDRIMLIASPFPKHRRAVASNGSVWHTYDQSLLDPADPSQLNESEDRFRNSSALSIRGDGGDTLWVVAAGQHDNPVELTDRTPQAPQNLGDLGHVIVVTACDGDCGEAAREAHLWPKANRPARSREHMVTIAAPGVAVPGLVAGAHYSVSDGTSPASAYVASVTAAMYACNRPHYDQPIKLKRNLVLSASPFLLEGDDGVSHVPVINPRLALQDPSKDWLVEAPGGLSLHDLKKNPEEITVDGWCREELPFTRLGNNEAVETMNIRRLTRVAGGQWVAFVKSRLWNEDPPHNQMYYPEGPFDIEDLGDGDPILMRDNGDAVPLGTLRDIYLHRDYETVSCG